MYSSYQVEKYECHTIKWCAQCNISFHTKFGVTIILSFLLCSYLISEFLHLKLGASRCLSAEHASFTEGGGGGGGGGVSNRLPV